MPNNENTTYDRLINAYLENLNISNNLFQQIVNIMELQENSLRNMIYDELHNENINREINSPIFNPSPPVTPPTNNSEPLIPPPPLVRHPVREMRRRNNQNTRIYNNYLTIVQRVGDYSSILATSP